MLKHLRIIGLLSVFISTLAQADLLSAKADDSWYLRILQETISPVSTPARWVFIGGTTLTTGFFMHKKRTDYDFLQSEYGEDKPQGSFSKVGDYGGQLVPNALYAVGMLTYGLLGANDKAMHRASYMFRATAYPALVSTILKFSFEEKRPSGGKYSFPSGHTTTAFAFATAVACEHDWYYGIPAFGLAVFVGMSRMNDNKHYFHDVLAGATLGSSYALGLYYLDKQRSVTDVTLYPVYSSQLAGLGLSKVW